MDKDSARYSSGTSPDTAKNAADCLVPGSSGKLSSGVRATGSAGTRTPSAPNRSSAANGSALNGSALNGSALNGSALNGSALNGSALNLPAQNRSQSGSMFRTPRPRTTTDQSRTSVLGVREFLEAFSDEQRAMLGDAIASAIIYYIERDTPVWLDALGIIAPEIVTRDRSRVVGEHLVVRSETRRSVRFEKCSELVTFQREQHAGVIETKELVTQVYANLPLPLQLQWPERELARLVRTYFRWLKHEVVIDGYCSRLAALGEFCSLHNRQGENLSDWYAGADIFLVSSYKQNIHVGQSRVFPRPILLDAWELLEAAHGKPVKTFEINLTTELTGLGFSLNSQEQAWALENNKLKVAVFRVPLKQANLQERRSTAPESKVALIYCTDGLRCSSLGSERSRAGCELVFQLEIVGAEVARAEVSPPRWPARALTMGWVLLHHTPNKVLRSGFGFSCNVPLVPSTSTESVQSELSVAVLRQEHEMVTVGVGPRFHSSINAIFTTEFAAVRGEQLASDQPFHYINIVGVNEEEAVLAESRSARHLTMLLKHRGLDQLTKLSRPSLVGRGPTGRSVSVITREARSTDPGIPNEAHTKTSELRIDSSSAPIH